MGKIIFNYLKVNNTYSNYRSEAEEIYSIKNEMAKIYERLCNEWKDSANVGFKNKFELQLDKLDNLSDFLEENSTFLEELSKKHNKSEDNFNSTMEKASVIYGYRD